MFEMMTGQLAFPVVVPSNATDDERVKIVRTSRTSRPHKASRLNASLNQGWDEFFSNALATEASKRIQSGQEMKRELTALLDKSTSNKAFGPSDVEEIVRQALQASQQAVSLPLAISLMEQACSSSPTINEKYSELLELWKRGIVQ